MNELDKSVYLIQNPAIGAVVLWRFVCGYYSAANEDKPVPFPLIFIVLPIIFREDLRNIISSTNKSSVLQKLSEKLFYNKKSDLVYSLQNISKLYRELTLSSFNIAIRSKLISISCEKALVIPIQTELCKMPKSSEIMCKSSEELGFWCSSLSLKEISLLLKVRF